MIDLNLCTLQHVKSLLRIKETGNTSFTDLIEKLVDIAKDRLVPATDTVTIHRLQGRAEAYEDLLKAINESPKVANRS